MALHVYVDGVEISSGSIGLRVDGDNPQGVGPFTESAHLMTYGAGGITFDDPDGNLDIVDYQTIWVEEDDCSQPRIFSGYITGHTIRRGPYRHAAGRIWDCDVIDLNLLLQMKLGHEIEAKRPAEDSDARLAFLIGSRMLDGLVFDNGWVDDSFAYGLGEADYRDSYAIDVLTDLVAPRHKNSYVFWDETAAAGEEAVLFFDEFQDPGRSSTLSISNVLADIVAAPTTVGAPDMASEMERDPSQVYSAVRLKSRVPTVFARRASTAIRIGIDREYLYSNDRIGQAATAAAVAENFLDEHDEPIEIIRCSVLVTSAQVGLIRAGHYIEARFTHLPGYETLTGVIVTRCTVRLTGNPKRYWLDLEMSNQIGNQSPSVPVGPPPQAQCEVTVRQYNSHDAQTWDAGLGTTVGFATAPLVGSVCAVSIGTAEDGEPPLDVPAGWTQVTTVTGYMGLDNQYFYTFVSDGTQAYGDSNGLEFTGGNTIRWAIWEMTGVAATPFDSTRVQNLTTTLQPITVDVPTGDCVVLYAVGMNTSFGLGTWTMTEPYITVDLSPAGGHPQMIWGHRQFEAAGGTEIPSAQRESVNYGGYAVSFEADTSACDETDPPEPGEVVPWTPADDVTPATSDTTATTPNGWCYIPGSLHVRVAGIDVLPSHVVESSPADGEFILDWVINSWESVEVSFQGC